MKNVLTLTLIVLLCLLTLSMFGTKMITVRSAPRIWVVGADIDGADFKTIQEAINAAVAGDTIFVRSGFYHEAVVVDKSLNLVGEQGKYPIIDADKIMSGSVVKVEDGVSVNITGFTIQYAGMDPRYGIELDWENSKVNISDNRIIGNRFGIFLRHTRDFVIAKNEIVNNTYGMQHDWECYNGIIKDNQVTGLRPLVDGDGITIFGGGNITVVNNTVRKFGWNIHVWQGNGIRVINNTVYDNASTGVLLDSSNNCTFDNNTFSTTQRGFEIMWYPNEPYLENNTISNNMIEGPDWGIQIYLVPQISRNVSNNVIVGNTIQLCDIGIYMRANTSANYIYHNNLVDNSVQALDEGDNSWDKGYPCGGNYWNDYAGTDLYWGEAQNSTGSDKIGDTPYQVSNAKNDSYPLVERWPTSPRAWTFENDTIRALTSSSITFFKVSETISFFVDTETMGVCSLIVPRSRFDGAFNLFIDSSVGGCLARWDPKYHMLDFAYAKGTHNITIVAEYLGKYTPGPVKGSPDMDGNGKVDILDLAMVAKYFGKPWPPPA